MLTYGDGVADVDIAPAARLPPRARQARHRHRRAPAGALRRPAARRRPRRRVQREAADRRGLDQRRLLRLRARACSTTSTATTAASERDAARAPGRRRPARWPTGTTASGSAWTRCATCSYLERALGARARPRGRCGRERRDVLARPARRSSPARPGCVGGWLVRRLRRRRAPTWSAWCATGCPQSELVRGGLLERVQRRPRRRPRPGAARARARRVRDRHGLPPRGADDRRRSPTATRSRRSRPTSAAPGRCSRPAAAARRCSRSSSPRPTRRTATSDSCPTTRTRRSQGRHPYDVSKSCADLIAQTYADDLRPAGRDHPLRQLLRRRRPQLEPDRPGHDPLGAARRAAGDPLRRHATSATTSTSRTAPPPTCCWPSGWRADPALRGEAFNFSNEIAASRCSSSSRRILGADGRAASSPTC